jgi:hypothetical protein
VEGRRIGGRRNMTRIECSRADSHNRPDQQ